MITPLLDCIPEAEWASPDCLTIARLLGCTPRGATAALRSALGMSPGPAKPAAGVLLVEAVHGIVIGRCVVDVTPKTGETSGRRWAWRRYPAGVRQQSITKPGAGLDIYAWANARQNRIAELGKPRQPEQLFLSASVLGPGITDAGRVAMLPDRELTEALRLLTAERDRRLGEARARIMDLGGAE